MTGDELVRGLLMLSETEYVAILDSCGVGPLGSHLLIGGIGTLMPSPTLEDLANARPTVFTLSYELGARLNRIKTIENDLEPEICAFSFESLIIHDYKTLETQIVGNSDNDAVLERLCAAARSFDTATPEQGLTATSSFTRREYLDAVDVIKERIRCGDTYQTNLTQQITVPTREKRPQDVFWRLRRDHPAPFAAYITRADSTVVSASPERFVRIGGSVRSPHVSKGHVASERHPRIETSPIKGTRRRGLTPEEDAELRHDLLTSPKDRAENTMIVDLLRNDLGRVCEYGSVRVEKLCELEEHPTLFHLVSTVTGELREDAAFSDIVRALFPCGSITGAPKISTMQIIERLEPTARGLSMGAIGYSIPAGLGVEPVTDLSVAIRTMVFRDGIAAFNVGGGITIDSDPEQEYEESLLKARALLSALNAEL
ncbi:MAG: aminodeoxychorismate synthase component I [Pyrinomonadaceae bacterium]